MATTGITDAKLIKMVRDSGHAFGPVILATSKREKLSFALALAPALAPAAGLPGAAVTIRRGKGNQDG
jgi:hypothetical protein